MSNDKKATVVETVKAVEAKKDDATAVKVEAVKVKKEFKGVIVTAKDLSEQLDKPVIVQRIDKPLTGAPYYNSKNSIKRFVMLHRSQKPTYRSYGETIPTYTITTEPVEGGSAHSVALVPENFKFKKLTGRMGVELQKKYKEKQLKNIGDTCTGPLSKMVGTDPEIFVEDEKGEIIPAFDFLEGKDKPTVYCNDNNLIYWDGFQAEFTPKADLCLAWVADSIQLGLKELNMLAKEHNPKAKLSTKTLIELSPKQLTETKTKHIEFGCRPSFNAYGLKAELDKDPRSIPYRSAGGHIHFGFGKQTDKNTINIVKSLDAILGVACVSLFAGYDHPLRRRYYGLPGEYRLPPHGIEYRVLSNAWIFHPAITNLVFDLGRRVCNFGYHDLLAQWDSTEEETIGTIINCDVDHARDILSRNKSLFSGLFKNLYDTTAIEQAVKIFSNGMDSGIKDASDIAKNWGLNTTWTNHCDGPNKNWRRAGATLATGTKI